MSRGDLSLLQADRLHSLMVMNLMLAAFLISLTEYLSEQLKGQQIYHGSQSSLIMAGELWRSSWHQEHEVTAPRRAPIRSRGGLYPSNTCPLLTHLKSYASSPKVSQPPEVAPPAQGPTVLTQVFGQDIYQWVEYLSSIHKAPEFCPQHYISQAWE